MKYIPINPVSRAFSRCRLRCAKTLATTGKRSDKIKQKRSEVTITMYFVARSKKANETSEPSPSAVSAAEEALDEDDNIDNIFHSQWKNSDVILVVGNTEFHVHRYILSMQSPVFERMFNGPFKEASQEKIKIEGKNAKDMVEFLMCLYPANMIKTMICKSCDCLNPEYVTILPIADEYQTEDVIVECLRQIKIAPENVFKVLPYAEKYERCVYNRCSRVIRERVSSAAVKKQLDEAKVEDNLAKTILQSKCDFLELAVNSAHKIIMLFFQEAMSHRNKATSVAALSGQKFKLQMCGHTITLESFHQAKQCKYCLTYYKRKFIAEMGAAFTYMEHEQMLTNQKAKTPFDLFRLLEIADSIKHAIIDMDS